MALLFLQKGRQRERDRDRDRTWEKKASLCRTHRETTFSLDENTCTDVYSYTAKNVYSGEMFFINTRRTKCLAACVTNVVTFCLFNAFPLNNIGDWFTRALSTMKKVRGEKKKKEKPSLAFVRRPWQHSISRCRIFWRENERCRKFKSYEINGRTSEPTMYGREDLRAST